MSEPRSPDLLRESEAEKTGTSALAAIRDSSVRAIYPNAQREAEEAAPAVSFFTEEQELPLREVANLESELSSLTLRLRRMAPDMDVCGEALA